MIQRLVLAIILGWSATSGAGVCGISLVVNDLHVTWDLNWTTIAVSITVNKTAAAACSFGLGFTKGGAANYNRYAAAGGGKQIFYQLYSDSGKTKMLKDVPDISSSNDVIMSGFPAGTNLTQTLQYYFDIPYAAATTPTVVASANYSDSFIINGYEGSVPTSFATPDFTSAVNVNVSVPSIIGLSLVDTGGVFQDSATSKSIDFGNLMPNAISRFDLRVRSNAGYTISFSSLNNGKLKHLTSTSTVAYSFRVNGGLLDLSNSASVPVTGITVAGQTALTGLGYPIQIQIGNYGAMALSGTHQDTIMITATTTE